MSELNLSASVPPLPDNHTAETTKASGNVAVQTTDAVKAVDGGPPYVTSPHGVVDAESGLYVLQFRESSSGDVEWQYPKQAVVDSYEKTASFTKTETVTTHAADSAGGETGTGVSEAIGDTSGSSGATVTVVAAETVKVEAPASTPTTTSVKTAPTPSST